MRIALLLAGSLAFITIAADSPAPAGREAFDRQLAAQFDKGKRYAFFIAIDKYPPPQAPLGGCVNDATLMIKTLAANCGYEKDNIVTLLDDQATKANIFKSLTDLLRKVQPTDTVIVWYCGHGMLTDGQSFLCPVDMDVMNPKLTAVRTDDLRTMLHDSKAAQKLLVLDSCHSGGAKAIGGGQPSSQELGGAFRRASGLITFAGCRRNQESGEFNGNGIFSGQFAIALAGAADFDKNGIVDSDELYRHLVTEVPAIAEQSQPGRQQVPVRIIGEDVVGVFALARPNGAAPAVAVKIPDRIKPGAVVENSIGMKLVGLPNGPATIGSPKTEYLRNDDEAQQAILLTRPIAMGAYEVTQAEFAKVMGKNPSYFSPTGDGADAVAGMNSDRLPVEQVTWMDAAAFCEKLSALPEERKARRAYRLPTECEWEAACRAGTATVFSTGDRLSPKQANIRGDRPYLDSEEGPALGRTAPVGSYKPNAHGLHDMHGNVAEWCQDFYTPRPFPTFAAYSMAEKGSKDAWWYLEKFIKELDEDDRKALAFPRDPTGPATGDTRVFRGGAFTGDVAFSRSACRRDKDPAYAYRGIGFRVVCYPANPERP